MKRLIPFLDSLADGSTPERPLWNIESAQDRKKPHWNYIDGCMLKAIWAVGEAMGEDKYLALVERYIDYFVDEDGAIIGYDPETYNLDNINEGKLLFPLYQRTGKEKYKKAIDALHGQLKRQPRTPEGNFWHKLIYPNQIWLDGLYMAQPFLMAYEMSMGGAAQCQDIVRQFDNVQRIMRDEKSGLFWHGYDASREMFWCDKQTGLSPNVWGRSVGWYAMALIDTIELMGERYFDERMKLTRYFKDLMDALKGHLDEQTGLVYQLPVLKGEPGNYLETSASCAAAYAYMKGARLQALPEYDFEMGKRILQSVVDLKMNGNVLTDICLVAGLGGMPGRGDYKLRDGSVAYYLSEPRVQNDAKGVAPMFFAYAELIRRGQS